MASLRPLSTAGHQTRTRTPTKRTFHWQQPVRKALWTKAANKEFICCFEQCPFVVHWPFCSSTPALCLFTIRTQLSFLHWRSHTSRLKWNVNTKRLQRLKPFKKQNYQITKRFRVPFKKGKAGENEIFIREWELVALYVSCLCSLPRGKEAVWKTTDWNKSSMGPFSFLFENKARFQLDKKKKKYLLIG